MSLGGGAGAGRPLPPFSYWLLLLLLLFYFYCSSHDRTTWIGNTCHVPCSIYHVPCTSKAAVAIPPVHPHYKRLPQTRRPARRGSSSPAVFCLVIWQPDTPCYRVCGPDPSHSTHFKGVFPEDNPHFTFPIEVMTY